MSWELNTDEAIAVELNVEDTLIIALVSMVNEVVKSMEVVKVTSCEVETKKEEDKLGLSSLTAWLSVDINVVVKGRTEELFVAAITLQVKF